MGKIILTGDRPTGKLHVGHYAGSLKNRVALQEEGDYDEMYVFIADVQALTDHAANPQKVRDSVMEVMYDYLAVGLDPEKVTFFIQSKIPQLAELTMYYMNLVTLSRLERNPTVKSEIKQKEFGSSLPVGFLTYPISQAADITAFDATTVPVGEDQLPMLEQTREIVRSFHHLYGENVLVEPEALLPDKKVAARLPGTDGLTKMSKSLGNCIYLSDDKETVQKKIMGMYTDPTHIRVEDPGNTKENPVFLYLETFATKEHFQKYLKEYEDFEALKAHYERGGLGDRKVKGFLADVMEDILEPIRTRRLYFMDHKEEVEKMLQNGCEKAEQKAAETLKRVKKALKIDYFE